MNQALRETGSKRGLSRANQNKAIRQEALREQLAAQGHVQHVSEIAHKLNDLDAEIDSLQVQRLKAAAEIKLKLIDKYLPSLKSVEHTGNIEHAHKQITEKDLQAVHEVRARIADR